MWQIFESCMTDFFFFYHYPLFGWQFGQTENSWFKFLILNILKTLLHCFISSSILIPFHVPYFFILEINSKFCHSLKFSIHVNFFKKALCSGTLWTHQSIFFNLFWIMRNLLSFFKYFFLTAFISHLSESLVFWILALLFYIPYLLNLFYILYFFLLHIFFLGKFLSFISKLLICFPFVG